MITTVEHMNHNKWGHTHEANTNYVCDVNVWTCYRAFAKRQPDGKGKDWGGDSADMDTNDSAGESSNPSPGETTVNPAMDLDDSDNMPKVNPLKWTVSTTVAFDNAKVTCFLTFLIIINWSCRLRN